MATCSVQWRTVRKGGDPKTDQEGTTRTPGWHPEENATQVPETKRYSRISVHQRSAKGRDPRTLASWRHWLMRVVAATAGTIWLGSHHAHLSRCRHALRLPCTTHERCWEASSAHFEIAPCALRRCDHAATCPSSSLDGVQTLLETVWYIAVMPL